MKFKETIIVSAFTCSGKTYAYNKYKDQLSILDINANEFAFEKRKRTEKELEEIKSKWDSTPHILSGEGYINKIKDDIVFDKNPNYPNNCINFIKENIGKVDIIFIDSYFEIRELMEQEKIKFITVYPQKGMLNEWIGRLYQNNKNYQINLIKNNWDTIIESGSIITEPHGLAIIMLGNNEYIDINVLQKYWR